MTRIKRAFLALSVGLAWMAVVVGGALYGWWRRPIAPSGDHQAFLTAAVEKARAIRSGNTAILMIDSGVISGEWYSPTVDSIDGNSVFEAASLSKWIAASAVMTLVQDAKLDLDRPVDDYLTRWHVPPSAFDQRQVTARRLLSHTAGLTDGLGFGDYRMDEPLPTIEQSLRAARASRDTAIAVGVGAEPGSGFRYSGGGYLVLELLIEEVAREPFDVFVTRRILAPLGMTRSGYGPIDSTQRVAHGYDSTGQRVPRVRYASNAATGLHTTTLDLAKFALAQIAPGAHTPLHPATINSMRVGHARAGGVDIWGLGTILYAPARNGGVVFGHDGVNDPAINATVRINAETRDAVIVLTSGSKTLASTIGGDWVLWQTGYPDVLSIPGEVRRVLPVAVAGALVLGVGIAWFTRRRRTVSMT